MCCVMAIAAKFITMQSPAEGGRGEHLKAFLKLPYQDDNTAVLQQSYSQQALAREHVSLAVQSTPVGLWHADFDNCTGSTDL